MKKPLKPLLDVDRINSNIDIESYPVSWWETNTPASCWSAFMDSEQDGPWEMTLVRLNECLKKYNAIYHQERGVLFKSEHDRLLFLLKFLR
jgi:hypothetical protein